MLVLSCPVGAGTRVRATRTNRVWFSGWSSTSSATMVSPYRSAASLGAMAASPLAPDSPNTRAASAVELAARRSAPGRARARYFWHWASVWG